MSTEEKDQNCPSCLSPLINMSKQSSFYNHLSHHTLSRFINLVLLITPKKIHKMYQRLKYRNAISEGKSGQYPPSKITLNLEPGEWVEILSYEEILSTLNSRGVHRGLYFMDEMKKFCGQKFRVYKILKVIKLEATGEIRKLKTRTVLLEGVYCDGINHGGCDRSCFHYWREAWLKRATDK